jgi:ribosomal L19-like protein
VRRAKLYYLRGRIGKAARVAERRWGIDEELIAAPAEAEGEALDAEGVSQSEADVEVVEPAAEEGEESAVSEGEAEAPPADEPPADEAPAEEEPAPEEPAEADDGRDAEEAASADEGDSGEPS